MASEGKKRSFTLGSGDVLNVRRMKQLVEFFLIMKKEKCGEDVRSRVLPWLKNTI